MNSEIVTQIILSGLIVIAIIRIATTKIGARWLRLCFIIILTVMLTRRVDEIGIQIGIDLIPQWISNLAAALAMLAIIAAFETARRKYEVTKRKHAYKERDLEYMWGEYTSQPRSDLLSIFTSPSQRQPIDTATPATAQHAPRVIT